jgi:hypothetical protein
LVINSPTTGDDAIVAETSVESGLSMMSWAFIIVGIVCCCLLVLVGVGVLLRARGADEDAYRPPSTLYDIHGESADVPYAGTLPQLDPYQQLSLASESTGMARGPPPPVGLADNSSGFPTTSFDGTAGFYRSANELGTGHDTYQNLEVDGGYQDLATMSISSSSPVPPVAPRPFGTQPNSYVTIQPPGVAGYEDLQVKPAAPSSSSPYSNVPRSASKGSSLFYSCD